MSGGREGGRQLTGPDGLWLEPLTVLAMAAVITTRVGLATTVLLASLRRPAILAKTAATSTTCGAVAWVWASGWAGSEPSTRPVVSTSVVGVVRLTDLWRSVGS